MGNRWTRQQQQAIDLHERNLLVSAAAGSGKTAVLVERIIQMITPENGIDVDSLLVVTFTRAAATEMKERIASRLNEMIRSSEGNRSHLLRQLALLGHASITTIDSFCLRVVRDYFGELDLDPDFRVADEGEKKLLEADCLEELLESRYEEADPAFLEFVEAYGGNKDDHYLGEYIQKLYTFAQSDPYPEEWLKNAAAGFHVTSMEELEAQPFMQYLLEDYRKIFQGLVKPSEDLLAICREPDGPYAYEEMCMDDHNHVLAFVQAESLIQMAELAKGLTFISKSRKKQDDADPDKKAFVSSHRDLLKKQIQSVAGELSRLDPEELLSVMMKLADPMETLIALTLDYAELLKAAKAEKNILDFGDIEHMALEILFDEDKNPSYAAMELRRQYEEILVDEYQDSNYLQDTILDAISRRLEDSPNMFMVGDVKQSIYRFRMARPELFMEKYDQYQDVEEGQTLYQKISLSRNFRSRSQVLQGINLIFDRIMTRNLGNVVYDQAAALYPGASFPDLTQENCLEGIVAEDHYITDEVHKALKLTLVDLDKEKNQEFLMDNQDDMETDSLNAEAHAVAEEILRITDPDHGMLVVDKKTGLYRKASYGDIAILMRGLTGKADVFLEVLSARGIPVCAAAQGYFSAFEVRTILSYLQIIDNPYQDIPLAAVMKSPIWNFSSEELAAIRGFYLGAGDQVDPRLYSAISYYLRQLEGSDHETVAGLWNKLAAFRDKLLSYHKASLYMQVQELIQHIYADTGFYDYVAAMPAGLVRRRNLDMLIEKALGFEKTSYHGLFQFTRYIEHLEKYEVDFEQGQMFGEQDDIVRIMTIHKSKGLEFPVVILAGMNRSFNMMDSRQGIVLHPEFGIAADYVDTNLRCKSVSLAMTALKRRIKMDTLGEELRLLYVAMTRAKEALIMVAGVNSVDKLLDKYEDSYTGPGPMEFHELSGAGSYLQWVMMAAGDRIYDWMEVEIRQMGEIFQQAAEDLVEAAGILTDLAHMAEEAAGDPGIRASVLWKRLEELQHYVYSYQEACGIRSKFSVSELKHKAMKDYGIDLEDQTDLHPDLKEIKSRLEKELVEEQEASAASDMPVSVEGEETDVSKETQKSGYSGADRGTAYHGLLELMDVETCAGSPDHETMKKEISRVVASGRMKKELTDLVSRKKLITFYRSGLADRMARAKSRGDLYQEREFIMNIPACQAQSQWTSREPVLIQGIIDVYWEEEGELVLLDYKTDSHVTEEDLHHRYDRQFELYARALSQILDKPVKEQYIWSFYLGHEVSMT